MSAVIQPGQLARHSSHQNRAHPTPVEEETSKEKTVSIPYVKGTTEKIKRAG